MDLPVAASTVTVSADTVAVVLVVRDAADLTLRALLALSEDEETEFHTVVVDDGSTDATAAVLASVQGDFTAIRQDRPNGFAPGCDRAVAETGHDFLIFLREDLVPTEGWLRGLLAPFTDPAVGAARPRVLDLAGHDVSSASWPCLAVRRAAFASIGGLGGAALAGRSSKATFTQALEVSGWSVVSARDSLLLTVPGAASAAAGLLEL